MIKGVSMPKPIQTPGTALKTLMDEYQLNPYTVGKAISVAHTSIRNILIGKSRLTIPIALRLAKYFGTTPDYWINLQTVAALSEAARDSKLTDSLKTITRVKKSALGKKAATPAGKPKAAPKPAVKGKIAPSEKPAAKKPK
jgi:addiction module HigA family antidote